MAPVVTVKGLSKHFRTKVKRAGFAASVGGMFRPRYKTIDAVAGIDFQIEAGEILAFIGPNGAGKSTTIKLITGILYPDAGENLDAQAARYLREDRDHWDDALRFKEARSRVFGDFLRSASSASPISLATPARRHHRDARRA